MDWLPTLAAFPIGTSALAVGLWWFLARLGWRLTRGSVGTSASILTFALFAAMVGLVTGLLLAYFPPALGEPYFVTDMSIGANEGDPLRVGLGGPTWLTLPALGLFFGIAAAFALRAFGWTLQRIVEPPLISDR
ncbi:hypothetical protein W59_11881 [Rhodococcus opacus RKJ300 = JCM 13270]|uniref:Uncharacterized protein n=1 Tax=Rhodococcus opacus RKJ300 = JCM 13270 TaxID=1165867 RepID=I0WTP0_RHOOP|nr:hypothetical protein W59_11881 [Rhodococcus opacus RKJ300 = JCM 13270]